MKIEVSENEKEVVISICPVFRVISKKDKYWKRKLPREIRKTKKYYQECRRRLNDCNTKKTKRNKPKK